jgi:DNA-binding MarR family transcriptional regulator
VGRLVAAGLAARELDPQERRRISIELTDRGRERSAASTTAVDAWWRERLAGLSEADLAALLDGLQVLDHLLATDGAVDPPVVA